MGKLQAKRAIQILSEKLQTIDELGRLGRGNDKFTKWRRDTEIAIERIFDPNGRHLSDFTDIRYGLIAFTTSTPDSAFDQAYQRGLASAKAILASMIDEIRDYEVEITPDGAELELIRRILRRFHVAARQLRNRHGARSAWVLDDEYDLQDFLNAILRLHFADVRREEYCPSYGGGCSRQDFLIKEIGVVVEVKMTRAGLDDKRVGEELIVDIAKYQNHPDCQTLVCFVYDPEQRLKNPAGLEGDLSMKSGSIEVVTIIVP